MADDKNLPPPEKEEQSAEAITGEGTKGESPDIATPEIAKAISKMPQPMQRVMEMMAVAFTSGGQRFHPIFDKFKPEHVDKFLDNLKTEEDHDFRYRSSSRIFHLLYTVLAVSALVWFVYYLLPRDKALLIDLLKIFIAFAGGFGSGIGWKALRRRND